MHLSAKGQVTLWSDPDIGINWPRLKDPILSVKDENAPLFKNIADSPLFLERIHEYPYNRWSWVYWFSSSS